MSHEEPSVQGARLDLEGLTDDARRRLNAILDDPSSYKNPPTLEGPARGSTLFTLERSFESSPHPQILLDRQGKLLRINTPGKNFLSMALPAINIDEVAKRSPAPIAGIDPMQAELLLERLAPVFEGVPTSWERELVSSDGMPRTFDVNITPVFGENEHVIAACITAIDITQERNRSADLERIVETTMLAHEVLNQLPVGVLLMDEDWLITHCLGDYERHLGMSRDEVQGKPLSMFVPKTKLERWHYLLDVSNYEALKEETYLIRRDGTRIEAEIRLQKISSGESAWAVLISDLSSQRELEEELRQAQKVEALGLLTSGIAHDLNNLLTVIMGHIELAQDELSPMHPAMQDLEGIHAAVDRATAMTLKLLAFARAQVVEPRNIDLIEVLSQVRPLLKHSLSEEIELDFKFNLKRAHVLADIVQIEQVLINMLINARDAIGSREGNITISLTPQRLRLPLNAVHGVIAPGNYVVLSVRDTGSGIPEELQEKIFEPFFTTKPEGKGTGLGLATCLRIARQNHGHIRCESVVGVGTRFELWLPAQKPQEISFASTISLDIIQQDGVLLVVEDEAALRDSMKRVLERYGYRVHTAKNGVDALAILDESSDIPEVIITDVVMPGMGGGALVEELKARYPNAEFLFMSGYADDILTTRGFHRQEVNFLAKPFSPKRLALHIHELLLKRRTMTF